MEMGMEMGIACGERQLEAAGLLATIEQLNLWLLVPNVPPPPPRRASSLWAAI